MARLIPNKQPLNTLGTSSAPETSSLPGEYQELIRLLNLVHGAVKIARESSGLQFYIACPECLDQEGGSEVSKKHLAINPGKCFAGQDSCSMCMKCGTVFRVNHLISMPTLDQRGIEYHPEVVPTQAGPNVDLLERDAKGNFVPKGPGEVVPITDLPHDHPAIIYLQSRQFEPAALWQQFRCSYCDQENPNIYYRRLEGGFRATSQGRLIFFADQHGVQVGWQARILEMVDGNSKYYFHPYRRQWEAVLTRESEQGAWTPLQGFQGWDPVKYYTAPGTRRNQVVLGLDAAVQFNAVHQHPRSFCYLTEGPLDAARLGPPAVAMLGKSVSEEQARILADHLQVAIVVPDNDEAGRKSLEAVGKRLAPKMTVVTAEVPRWAKDIGDLSPDQADMFRRVTLNGLFYHGK